MGASNSLCDHFGLLADELHSFWSWEPAANYLSNLEFSLSCRLVRNALLDVGFKAILEDISDCQRYEHGLKETAEHTFFYCPLVRPFWGQFGELTARIEPEHHVSIDLAYVCYNVSPP